MWIMIKNVSCDGYIVDFIYDVTGNYYERGRHCFIYSNNIISPLSLLKVLKWYLFCLPMLAAFNFNDLFSYKALFIESGLDLNVFDIFFLMYSHVSIIKTINKPSSKALKKSTSGR